MKAMVEGKRRAILDDVVLGVGADEVVHASLDATYAGAPNLRCPSASNAELLLAPCDHEPPDAPLLPDDEEGRRPRRHARPT
jgi:hypothetical protein